MPSAGHLQITGADRLVLSPEAEKAVAAGGLNRDQAAAAYSEARQVLVLGPPGAGKTGTLSVRIGVQLDRGVDSDLIFCGTFTAASGAEIVSRVNAKHGGRLRSRKGGKLAFGTLNSLGLRCLQVLAPRVGLGNQLKLVRGGEASAIVKRLGIDFGGGGRRRGASSGNDKSGQKGIEVSAEDLGWHGPGFGGHEAPQFSGAGDGPAKNVLAQLLAGKVPAAIELGRVHDLPFLELVSRWEERLIFPEDAIRIAEGDGGRCVPDEELVKRAHDYAKYKEALRTEGLIDFADQIALPVQILRQNDAMRTAFQSRWSDVIVDEYQDVNTALGALVDLLAGGQARLWCVGDPDQTLYGFRGSEPGYILKFRERWPDAEVIALHENYRSHPDIVAAANRLIRNNKDRYETTMTATRPKVQLPEAIGRALATPSPKRAPGLVRPVPVEVVCYPTDDDEALETARKVKDLIAAGVKPTEIAILCRAGYRSYPVVQALRGQCIRIRVLRGSEKGEPEESQLVEGLIRATYFPVASGPGCTDLDMIRRLLGTGEKGERLIQEARCLKKDGMDTPNQWVKLTEAVEEIVSAEGALAQVGKGGDPDKLANAAERFALRVKSATQAAAACGSYEAWCAAAAVVGKADADGGGVLITTLASIHGAKGLEYGHVLVIGAENDVCPDEGNVANEEERRLFFVGITRAIDSLTVSYAVRRAGDWRDAQPSVYIREAFHGTPGIAWTDYGPSMGTAPRTANENAAQPPAQSVVSSAADGLDLEALTGAAARRQIRRRPKAAAVAVAAEAAPPATGLESWVNATQGPMPTPAPIVPVADRPVAIPSASGPPAAGGVQEGELLRFGLSCRGGENSAVWEVVLTTGQGQVIIDSLVNPNGDYMAVVDAIAVGVNPDVLIDAPEMAAVLEEVRRIVTAAGAATGTRTNICVDNTQIAIALGITHWSDVTVSNRNSPSST